MIRVSIDPQELVFRLDGHAGYAPEGQDIVCASASMMAAMRLDAPLAFCQAAAAWGSCATPAPPGICA